LSSSNTQELVSVVVPAYKHENYIVDTLESIAKQTYENLELVLVDDCSPDRTVATAAEWLCSPQAEDRFASVRLLRNDRNSGAHFSLNRGILEAKGSILSLMNSDDLYHPDRITKLVNAMNTENTEFAFSKVIPVDDTGKYVPPWRLPDTLQNVFDFADQVEANFPSISFGFLAQNMAVSTGNFVFRRDLYARIGSFKPLLYVHDWEFIIHMIFECEPAYVPEELYLYRIHGTNSFSQLAHVAEVEGLIIAEKFYRLSQDKRPKNNMAPVCENWPEVLNVFKDRLLIMNVGPFITNKTLL
jgi:glycosyltransferase involved in cell wall biosynthesis